MSASQKKKLRNEQNAAQMTEKQQQAAKEARQLRLYTVLFGVVIALMICVVIFTTVSNSGIIQRNTTAVTVDGTKISAAELNHYYIDALNSYVNTYGDYLSLFGLDSSVALDEQYVDEEAGQTWADYFLETATENIHSVYSLYNAAIADGYTISEENAAEIDSYINGTLALYAAYNGYSDVSAYITALYGSGCNEDTFRSYMEVQYIASQYASDYNDSLVYTDEDLRSADSEEPKAYNSYSYNYYYLSSSKFLEGGTTDEDGVLTYTDEEKAAALAACEEAAIALTGESITDTVLLDKAISNLDINADTTAASTACDNYLYAKVDATLQDWVTSEDRQAGDKTYIAYETSSTDDDGNTTTTVNGYYVVFFTGSTDNNYLMSNVRHILVAFEGGTTDDDGNTTYSDEEKAAAKTEAEELLAEFLAGDATEESFTALALENSDDVDSYGNVNNEGLYENIVPSSSYVENFLNWAIDDSRVAGDTGIVETEYGYHVMYYVSDSEESYRDYMIETDLRSADLTEWETALHEAAVVTVKNTSKCKTDLVLSSN